MPIESGLVRQDFRLCHATTERCGDLTVCRSLSGETCWVAKMSESTGIPVSVAAISERPYTRLEKQPNGTYILKCTYPHKPQDVEADSPECGGAIGRVQHGYVIFGTETLSADGSET